MPIQWLREKPDMLFISGFFMHIAQALDLIARYYSFCNPLTSLGGQVFNALIMV